MIMLLEYMFSILLAIAPALACTPFSTNFPSGSVSLASQHNSAQFISITPPNSFSVDNGLFIYLRRPAGETVTEGGVNNQLGEGATINSTFTLLYGKVTFEVSAPFSVPGAVVAVILIADEHDEIDIELLPGDAGHWQSNVYAPRPSDKQPLWGVFGEIEEFPHSPRSISSTHAYTVDWNKDRIIWSVDGTAVRTLEPDQTYKNGAIHYPSHAARLQLGIWDASSPLGTAQWAKGPIDWKRAPSDIHAIIKSVEVECPDT
ncbi:glycoside hydrolase family 16 protein [Ramaria rubella]|nr:glycoside hydrolase family 16 protein [Ramaria rubella]